MTEADLSLVLNRLFDAAPFLPGDSPPAVQASLADVPALAAEVLRLGALLERAEWSAGVTSQHCPWCRGAHLSGHRFDCAAFPPAKGRAMVAGRRAR